MTTTTKPPEKKGFTSAEKWIIWAVFCMLISLSTYRFSVFIGLMVLSAAAKLFAKKQKFVLATILSILGILTLGLSKFLI